MSGQPLDEDEKRNALAWTISHLEERLQDPDLSASARESFVEQLHVLKEREGR